MVSVWLKKLSIVFVMALFSVITLSVAAYAQDDTAKAQKNKELINAARKELNNTRWVIVLNNMATKARLDDIIEFSDNKVGAKELIKKGFPASNFTVSVENEGMIVWETMQTSEREGLAFWRAEVENGVTRGVLSRHLKDKTTEDYTFFSTSKESISEATEVKEEPKKEEIKPEIVEAKPVKEEVKKEEQGQNPKKKNKKDKKR